METITIGLIIGVVSFVIYSFLNSKSSKSDTPNNYLNEIYYRNRNFEYILDIISKCGYKRPVKLSQFLNDVGEHNRQSDLYSYLTSNEFKSQYDFFNVTSIVTNGENDLILSVNEDEFKHNNDVSNDSPIEDILLDLEEYDEYDDRIELPIRGINFRNLTESNIGSFDGYIMPDGDNKHDKYAIGVYGSDDTHFGFIEKGQKALYDKIEEGSGFINAKLDIDTFIEEDTGKKRFQGTASIMKADLL